MFLLATFDEAASEVLFEHPRLRVVGVPMRDLFVMKLYRAHPNDVADMATIWSRTGFKTGREVVDAYFAAFPHAPKDPHLDSFVVEIAAQAGYIIPSR